MNDPNYSDAELERYFADAAARHAGRAGAGGNGAPAGRPPEADEELVRHFGPGVAPPPPRTGGDGAPARTAPPRPQAAPPQRRTYAPPPPPGPDADIVRRSNRFLRYALAVMAAGAGLVLLVLLWLARDLPSLEQIENPRNMLATVVFTADEEELARYYSEENRTWVPLDSISEHVVHA